MMLTSGVYAYLFRLIYHTGIEVFLTERNAPIQNSKLNIQNLTFSIPNYQKENSFS